MTIIVLLVLSGTVISMLTGEDGILIQAQETKFKSELSSLKDEYMLFINNKKLESPIQFKEESLWASKNSLTYNTKTEENGNIEDVLPSISKSLKEKIEIVKGKLLIKTQNEREVEWAEQIGVEVNPYEITEDGVLVSSNGNLLLIDEEGTLELPDTITEIGEGAFAKVEGLKTIVIPGSVKIIGANAFASNKTLEKVIIEDGVQVIKENAFSHCSNLKEIIIPQSVTSIGMEAMYNCTSLDNIILPSNIKIINAYTFGLCSNLKNITLSENLTTIKDNAFLSCVGLNSITIHANVNSISPIAFRGCENITEIEIDMNNKNYYFNNGMLMNKNGTEIYFITENILAQSDVLQIPEGIEIFANSISAYNNITKIILPKTLNKLGESNFPKSISSIEVTEGNNVFCVENNCLYSADKKTLYYCYSKEENITLGEGVETILNGSFKTATKAKNIVFPESLIKIEDKVFGLHLNQLEKIYIGKNVNYIGSLFKYMNYSGTVIIDENNKSYMIKDDILYSKDGKTIITSLKEITGKFILDSNVEIIGSFAFYNQDKMSEIELPKGLKIIKMSAFGDCTDLKSINIPNAVETIEIKCFSESNSLVEIIIDKKEGSISGAPWGCKHGMKAIKWNG